MRKDRTTSERDAMYLEDIRASTTLIASYLKGIKVGAFVGNEEKTDAVSRRLIVIGEAVKSLSEPTRRRLAEAHPDIRWDDIAKLKDKLTHHYWTIDPEQLWEIARVHVPILKRAIQPLARAPRRP